MGPHSGIGAYLRELRSGRGLSLGRLAERAQLAKGTLSYWESGRFQPRLPELEAALKALGATKRERDFALTLVDAPRALRRVREEDDRGPMPAIGDLLRSLRRRAGKSKEQVAAELRVHPSAVRRWEKSEVVVPEERIGDLCRALNASLQERDALRQRRLRLWTPGQGEAIDPEAAFERSERLQVEAGEGAAPLIELELLLMEAQLWGRASDSPAARRALARVYTAHAAFLETSGRGMEVMPYASRALDLVARSFPPESWWGNAVHAIGFVLAPKMGKLRNRRRIAYLRQWLDFTDDPSWRSDLFRDMSQYSAEGGEYETALRYGEEAAAAAERLGNDNEARLARHIQVMTLIELHRYTDALTLLPSDPHPNIHQHTYEEAHWIRTLIGLQEWDDAHTRLNALYAFVRERHLSPEGPDNLARLFQR